MSTTKLRIHTWPDRLLTKACKKVKVIDEPVRRNLDEMLELMRQTQGMGLAANQVGLRQSLAVIEIPEKVFKLVNPRIKKQEGSISFLEGCLSFPELEIEIKRAKKVLVEAHDEHGQKIEIEAEGLLAVIFQHEIDHLQGKIFIERIPFLKRLQIIPKLKEIAKKTKNGLREQEKK